jgi:hypothetical protein
VTTLARTAAALLAFALISSSALAQEDDKARAKALFAEGQAEYNLGHFAKALELYEGAYKIKAVPALLFNIAQCHRQLGDMRSAATTYRAYLRTAKAEDPGREKATTLLAEVESAIQKQAQAQGATPLGTQPDGKPLAPEGPTEIAASEAPTAAPSETSQPATAPATNQPAASTAAPAAAVSTTAIPAEPPQKGRTFTWIAAGGTAAALAGGVIFGLKSKSTASDLQGNPHPRAQIDQLTPEVKSDASKANAFFAATAVLAVATGTLFVLQF